MTQRLVNKVAVVTGAGQGIGLGIAMSLHSEGARVVLADVKPDIEQVAIDLGENALAVHADVTQWTDVQALMSAAVEAFGGLDVLVNNAGIDGDWFPTAECTLENFDRVIGVNLRGVFMGMKAAIPHMLERGGGSLINIGSMVGLVAVPGIPAYIASKGGVIALTRATAVEYGSVGIRANSICPGCIETPLSQSGEPRREGDKGVALTPMGRWGRPEEIASLAVYFASDESRYTTGQAISVDGGYTAL
jgi:NAD(P)-dependent dehydrogenase (short-subunit alcohol dehydrogenase family)